MLKTKRHKTKNTGIIVGADKRLLRGGAQPSRFLLVGVMSLVTIAGAYLIYSSFAAETAQVMVTVNRTTPNGVSKWVPAHTSVSTEFYNGSSWPNNQGPDTTPGTAQYNARALELEGVSQHNVHIMAWARSSPWLTETATAPDPNAAYNTSSWGGYGMDQEIKRAADKGLQPTITLAMAPGWMLGKRTSGNGIVTPMADYDTVAGYYASRVTTDKMDKWLQLVDSIVKRYSKAPYNVRTYDIWNEFKGYYNPDTNNYDAGTYCGTPGKADMGYTCFYNKTRAQILASAASIGVTSGIRTGGPYVVGDLWDNSGAGGFPVNDARGSANNTLSGAKTYGWVDGRPLDAIKTWLANKSGAEFIALRFSYDTRANTMLGTDWDALKYAGDLAQWVKGLPEATYPGASTLPIWNAEHYTSPKVDASLPAKQDAFSAESYRIGVRNGYEAMLRWGSDGLDGLNLWTTTKVTNNHEIRTGDGLAGNGQEAQKLFKQYFFAGKQLYPETISDSTLISALASDTHTMLINKTNTQLTVALNGTNTTLAPYAVVVVQDGGTTTPPPPPPPSLTLKLINADTDQTITNPMTNGMTIDLKNARNLNIDASASVPIESVRFDDAHDGATSTVIESLPPYAIGLDAGTGSTDYLPWTPTVGTHTLTVKAYSADGATGTELVSTTINFTVTDSTVASTGWDLVYQDDFNTLNTSSTSPTSWSLYNSTGHNGNGLRRPEAISVANGELVITAQNVDTDGDGVVDKIRSGGMSNRMNLTYGRYEVRMRVEADPSRSMAGVALTWPQSGVWPGDGELDWFETSRDRYPFSTFIHYPCNEYLNKVCPSPYQTRFTHNADATQYHTVIMEWKPDSIQIFRDGSLAKTDAGADKISNTQQIPDVPHHVTLQLDAQDTYNSSGTKIQPLLAPGPVRMYVDYVKVSKMSTGSGTTDTTPPNVAMTAPSNGGTVSGIVTSSANAIDPPGTTNGAGISKVDFYLDNTAATGTPNMSDTSISYDYSFDSKLLSNSFHTVTARAYDMAGNSQIATVSFTVGNTDTQAPTAPTNLVASAASATQVNLSWTAASDNVGVAKYNILRNGAVVATVNAPATTYQNTGLTASTTYNYQVQAVDVANNTSPSSNTATATTLAAPDTTPPTAPTGLTAAATSASFVALSWTASTDSGGSGLKGYNVYRNGSTTPLNGSTPITTTSYGDGTVAAATAYSYQVEAVDGANNKSPKTAAVAVTTPAGPVTLSFLPAADAWVSQKFPTRTYGTTSQLKADSTPNQDMLIRFNVAGIGAKQIKSAKLRLYVANSSNSGGTFHRVSSNTWSEAAVTWNTAPIADTATLASLGAVNSGSIVEVDLTSLINGDGTYGLRINTASSDTIIYNSKEAASNKPQLVLVVE